MERLGRATDRATDRERREKDERRETDSARGVRVAQVRGTGKKHSFTFNVNIRQYNILHHTTI